jgi:hypothetical protein
LRCRGIIGDAFNKRRDFIEKLLGEHTLSPLDAKNASEHDSAVSNDSAAIPGQPHGALALPKVVVCHRHKRVTGIRDGLSVIPIVMCGLLAPMTKKMVFTLYKNHQ